MDPRQRLWRYAEGRRVRTASTVHAPPKAALLFALLEGGVCCSPRLLERGSLPRESLSSSSLSERSGSARTCVCQGTISSPRTNIVFPRNDVCIPNVFHTHASLRSVMWSDFIHYLKMNESSCCIILFVLQNKCQTFSAFLKMFFKNP